MTSSSSSRRAILDRIGAATASQTGNAEYDQLPRAYIHRGELDGESRIHLMTERLREYGADVAESMPGLLPTVIAEQLQQSGRRSFVVPIGLPPAWMPAGFKWNIDHALDAAEIENCDGVVTGASAGIADSGTIVLHHSSMEGRRIITLLPDWHLCVINASQIVETLPEYFERCPEPPALATYISGPSATADIEMTRIQCVHGPRFLTVILVRDDR